MTRRRLISLAIVSAIVGVASFWFALGRDPLGSSARRAWKDQAIVAIQKRVDDATWIEEEAVRRRVRTVEDAIEGRWVGDELLLMRNGDWLVCRNVCAKEQTTRFTHDLFIGRGSDGKWYYSTFHLCVGKCVLQIESQPASLAAFVEGYWLEPFDGKSDDALRKTWDGQPNYGEAKRQNAIAHGLAPTPG